MKNILFITRMYVSKVLIATLLTYVYLTNSSPSCEGRLEKNSPAFFSEELETADEAQEELGKELADNQKTLESNQE